MAEVVIFLQKKRKPALFICSMSLLQQSSFQVVMPHGLSEGLYFACIIIISLNLGCNFEIVFGTRTYPNYSADWSTSAFYACQYIFYLEK